MRFSVAYKRRNMSLSSCLRFFFFNDTATTEIYTLSLHDALPIQNPCRRMAIEGPPRSPRTRFLDRKSTRLNSSPDQISYAVFCLKKKNRPNNESSFTKKLKNTKKLQHNKLRT